MEKCIFWPVVIWAMNFTFRSDTTGYRYIPLRIQRPAVMPLPRLWAWFSGALHLLWSFTPVLSGCKTVPAQSGSILHAFWMIGQDAEQQRTRPSNIPVVRGCSDQGLCTGQPLYLASFQTQESKGIYDKIRTLSQTDKQCHVPLMNSCLPSTTQRSEKMRNIEYSQTKWYQISKGENTGEGQILVTLKS